MWSDRNISSEDELLNFGFACSKFTGLKFVPDTDAIMYI